MVKGIINYTKAQLFWLVSLRVIIGWHFLYEGLDKLVNPNWSSFAYLMDSEGIFKGIFHHMASNPGILRVIDFINIWGLIAIGLSLITGLLSRWAGIAGIILLTLYYLSHPPFIGFQYDIPMEGNYLIINKILIELVALAVLLVFPTSRQVGLDSLLFHHHRKTH